MENIELNTHKGIVRVGTRIRIIHLNNGNSKIDDSDYDGKEGVVAFFDQIPPEANPGMHGSWGGLAVYDSDEFEILSGYNDEVKAFARDEDESAKKRSRIRENNSEIARQIEAHERAVAELRSRLINQTVEIPEPKRVIEALARDLAGRLNLHFETSGPQGLRNEYRIRLLDCDPEGLSILEHHNHTVHCLTITADRRSNESNRTVFLYDTGKKKTGANACPPGSIGEQNGFNNEQAQLSEDIEEIIKILQR